MLAAIARRRSPALTLALSGLLFAGASSASALDSTYLAPFQRAEADFSPPCHDLGCQGEAYASAETGGALHARTELVAAGIGRGEVALAWIGLSHTLDETATEISFELRLHIDEAFASAVGAPGARGVVLVGLEAVHLSSRWAYASSWQPIVAAEAPKSEQEARDQDFLVPARIGDGRSIPPGQIEITAYLLAEATTMPPHAPSAAPAGSCTGDCVGAGQVLARVSGVVESVTVDEVR